MLSYIPFSPPPSPSAVCWWIWSTLTTVYTVSHNITQQNYFLNRVCVNIFVCFLPCNQLPHLLQAEVYQHTPHHIPTAIYQVLNTVQTHPSVFLFMYITTIHSPKENLSVNNVEPREVYIICFLQCSHAWRQDSDQSRFLYPNVDEVQVFTKTLTCTHTMCVHFLSVR